MDKKQNELIMSYLNKRDVERASFMYLLIEGLSWSKEDISRIYNFNEERLDIDGLDNYLSWASNGEYKCIKLATILFNGGAHFSPDELMINHLLSGLDSKHLGACLDAMEIRYGNPSKILNKQKSPNRSNRER